MGETVMLNRIVIGFLLMNIALEAKLVELIKVNPHIQLDIRYATANNFVHKKVYAQARCFVEEKVAQALSAAQQELEKQNLGLKIWDGYRPLSVQKIFWDLLPDARYVADPNKGSRHNRGCSVDVTLVDKQGKELPMGTDFDDFSEKAHRNCTKLSPQILANRKLLEEVLTRHKFVGWEYEWWHFDYTDWSEYPLLDIPFEAL